MAKEDKRTNNILQSTTQKTIDWIEQHKPHKKNKDELGCYGWISSSCSANGTHHEWLLFKCQIAIIQWEVTFDEMIDDVRFILS
jgi:hypothetical protein